MRAIDTLRKLINDIEGDADPILWDILREGTEHDWKCEQDDGMRLTSVLTEIEDDLSSEVDKESRCYVSLLDKAFSVCKSLGVDFKAEDGGEAALEKLRKEVAYLPLVRQAMDNIEQEVKSGLNSVAERLGIRDEIQGLPISGVCPRIIEEMGRRLAPDDVEWPRYDDGEPVRFGDELPDFSGTIYKTVKNIVFTSNGRVVIDNGGGSANVSVTLKSGERVNRYVLASDGEPLEVGQTVWVASDGDGPYIVDRIRTSDGALDTHYADNENEHLHIRPDLVTHRRPVLDADGVPIKAGDTVYTLSEPDEYKVISVLDNENVGVEFHDSWLTFLAKGLTHTKPEPPDSWERIQKEARGIVYDIAWHLGNWSPSDFKDADDDVQARVLDLVRRCKELANREQL